MGRGKSQSFAQKVSGSFATISCAWPHGAVCVTNTLKVHERAIFPPPPQKSEKKQEYLEEKTTPLQENEMFSRND